MSVDLTITVGQRTPLIFAGIPLEETCGDCDATGYQAVRGQTLRPEIVTCPRCKGQGVFPTEDGRLLLYFVGQYPDIIARHAKQRLRPSGDGGEKLL